MLLVTASKIVNTFAGDDFLCKLLVDAQNSFKIIA